MTSEIQYFSSSQTSNKQKNIHNLIRVKNRTLNQWEQYYQESFLQSFPVTIQFPTGMRCNIKCNFCTDRKQGGNNYKDISFDKFRTVIEEKGWAQVFERITSVALYGWGEPLFNPDYEKIFDYVTGNFPMLSISICTNGILFNEKWAGKITAIQGSDVNFSVNAATKETYLKLTGSNQFERVINNIRSLSELRNSKQKKNPYIALSYVATTENIRELPQFVNVAADLKADCVFVQDIMLLTKDTEQLSLMNEPDVAYKMFEAAEKQAIKRKLNIHFFASHQVDYIQKTHEQTHHDTLPPPGSTIEEETVPSPYFSNTDCLDPWERFMIGGDGEVLPCCRFQDLSEISFGNIYKQDFSEIWNGEAYRYLRKTINTENPPPSCAACPRKIGLD